MINSGNLLFSSLLSRVNNKTLFIELDTIAANGIKSSIIKCRILRCQEPASAKIGRMNSVQAHLLRVFRAWFLADAPGWLLSTEQPFGHYMNALLPMRPPPLSSPDAGYFSA